MREIPNDKESVDRKLEGEKLAKAARMLRDQFSIYYKTPILDNVEVRFETGGIKRRILNTVDGDQQNLHVDAGNGEYVQILVARGPLGKNAITYVAHGSELTIHEDSELTVREVQGVLQQIFPK